MSTLLPRRAALLLAAFGAACSQDAPAQKGGPKGPPSFPVEVAKVAADRVAFAVSAVGSVEAFEVVAVTARVAGVVERVAFKEGQLVEPGQTLVEIEPARYELAVSAAAASAEKAEAARADAEAGLTRREEAAKSSPGLLPAEELETWRTKAKTAAAESELAGVALSQARLNLKDARVKSALRGVIETRTVSTGQYVQPGAVLATLLRRDPLLLRFKVPELDAARLAAGMTATFTVRGDTRPRSAAITAVGGAADAASRMIEITAEVAEADREDLRPGSFAEVSVEVGAADAPVVPETAVRPSENGFLAFVIEDGVAKRRILTLGMRTADGRIEVRDGLAAGETLVVRGAEALREGVKVKIEKPGGAAGAASAPAGAPKGAAPAGGEKAPAGGPDPAPAPATTPAGRTP
jgi:membrane fusion protein, multidrug efflux system